MVSSTLNCDIPLLRCAVNEVSFEVALQWAIEALEDAKTAIGGIDHVLFLASTGHR